MTKNSHQKSTRKTALVVAPGRGAYQAEELGYLHRHHKDRREFVHTLDELRTSLGQTTITALDQADRFVRSRHTNGENASLLIYACALADFMAINKDQYDIVAITGNSMGWYLALACAGVVPGKNGAHLVNHMGTLMHEKGVGGQLIYPVTDDEWRPKPAKRALVYEALEKTRKLGHKVYISIELGGTLVLAGDKAGLEMLTQLLPAEGRYPMHLSHHAAFHTPLLDFIIPQAQASLPLDLFSQPQIPVIDGQGQIWIPDGTDIQRLYDYTLGTQINQTYNFTKAIITGVKEFAPDIVIVLGPGTSMGPPVAQSLIEHQWYKFDSKTSFKKSQMTAPKVLSMGIDEQRKLVID